MGQAVIRIIPAAVAMGVIFLLSHQPGDRFDPYLFRWADKLAHLVVYAALAFTLIYAFPKHYRCSEKYMVAAVSLLLCLLYGISDEFHQSFIPGRYPSITDIVADVFGAALACMFWLWMNRTEHAGSPLKR